MRKVKIYLAKSNLCSLELAARVRSYLSSINDAELVEFSGELYNNISLKESDILVVIPPIVQEEVKIHWSIIRKGLYVGRGIFQQIEDFRKSRVSNKTTYEFIVEEISNSKNKKGIYCLRQIKASTLVLNPPNWTWKWGIVIYDSEITIDLDAIVYETTQARTQGRNFQEVFKSAQDKYCVGTTGLSCDITPEQDLKPLLIKRRNKLKT